MSLRRIVVVSKEVEVQQLARQACQQIFVADDLNEALDITKTANPDLILFDPSFNPQHIREFLNEAIENSIHVPAIILSSDKKGLGSSVEFMQNGPDTIGLVGIEYLRDTQDYSRLEQIVSRIKNQSAVHMEDKFDSISPEKNDSEFFADEVAGSACMVGRSRAFLKTLGMIRLVAASRCNPVLIIGETGTGKELAAKAIHILRHPNEQFIAVNCAALTANLLESELFGHVKGSFTSADRDKTGLLELAGCGTIFLDEISEMPLDLQAKLLRVLQEKTFRKVGGIKNITCNATIIASSNRNLYKEMKLNRFRRDLYYRLNICPVIIALLRSPDRRDDIPLLAKYFLKTSNICPEKNKKITTLTKLAVENLQKHDWPGNVRELRNVIERAILLETTDKIGFNSIVIDPAEEGYDHTQCFTTISDGKQFSNSPAADEFPQSDLSPTESGITSRIKDFSLEKAERELIARALAETGWQKTQAASLLGITRATLYTKVKQYNIKCNSAKQRFRLPQCYGGQVAAKHEKDTAFQQECPASRESQEPNIADDLCTCAPVPFHH
jgi:DNA-binding NtrC family response regulator